MINFDILVEGGDSGLVVIDIVLGSLYGYIVRGCLGFRVVYIIVVIEVFDYFC